MRGAAALALLCAAGCSFDASGVVPRDAGREDAATLVDGALDGGRDAGDAMMAADAACRTDLDLVVRVNGLPRPAGSAPLPVLLGDSVELDIVGTCSPHGAVSVVWTVTPAAALLPAPSAPAVSAVALEPTTYLVHVEATVATAPPTLRTLDLTAFRAAPFVELTAIGGGGKAEANDVAVGQGRLWVATSDGAYSAPTSTIVPPAVTWQDVAGGAPFAGGAPTNLKWLSVLAYPRAPWIFFGAENSFELLRVDATDASNLVRNVRDMGPPFGGAGAPLVLGMAPLGAQGLWIATSAGLVPTTDAGSTWGMLNAPLGDTRIEAVVEVTTTPARHIAGSDDLYDLTSNGSTSLLAGDDKVRDLAWDPARSLLWSATQGNGVFAHQLGAGGTLTQVYNLRTATSGLPHDDVRALAVDGSGDVWMATNGGAARWKRDRALVVPMAAAAGVTVNNTLAVALDGRRVFLGSKGRGVLVLEVR